MSDERFARPSGRLHVSLVVVARNEEAKIEACLRSLRDQDYPSDLVEVLLVDDGSTDRTVELARGVLPNLRVISNPSSSISSNRNRGLREAKHPYVGFIDADCEAPPHWLGRLTEAMDRLGAAAVGGGNVPPAGETTFYDALALMLDTYIGSRGSVQGKVFQQEMDVPHLPGLNVLYDKSALEAVGGWDEHFALICEDEDLSRRLDDQGFRLVYVPDAVLVHRQRGDFRSWARNMFTYGKGRVWLIRRHPRVWEPQLLIPPLLPLLLWAYLPVILLVGSWVAIRAKRPHLFVHVAALYTVTHVAFGLGQWYGAFTAGDSEISRRQPGSAKVGLLVLKNAGNLGDEAILSCVGRRIVRDGLPNARLFAVGLGPSGLDVRAIPADREGFSRVAHQLLAPREDSRRVRVWHAETWVQGLRLVWVMWSFRALFFCGGQWMHDLGAAHHLFVTSFLGGSRILGTRVGVFCIGMGPLRSGWSKWAVRFALGGRSSLVIVRDRRSLELCREIGFESARLGLDPVLELDTGHIPWSEREPVVGLSPCAWFRFESLYDTDEAAAEALVGELADLLEALSGQGLALRLLPTMNPEDLSFSRKVEAELRSRGPKVEIIETVSMTPDELQAEIGRLKILISMRLHPTIFATNAGTPFVALNYATKVEEYCRDLGADEALVGLDDSAWAREVVERAKERLDSGNEVVESLETARAALVEERLAPAHAHLREWLASIASEQRGAGSRHPV